MALILADRVKETTTTTGTGTVTLAGAVTGYQSFTAIGDGNTTYYTIASQSNSEWEVGIGTYTSSGTTLSRTTVLSSSNAGSLVNFSSGTKDVFVTYTAKKAVIVNDLGDVLVNQSTDQGTGVLQVTGNSSFNGVVTDKSLNLQGGNNFFAWSQDGTNALWTKSNATVSGALFTAPNGTTTANAILETATNSIHYLSSQGQSYTFSSGSVYTVSVYFKSLNNQYAQITFGTGVGAGTNYATFDLINGTVAASSNGTATINQSSNGFYRCTFSITASASVPESVYFLTSNASSGRAPSYAGNTSNGFYWWGAQLELGTVASAYTPTTTVAITTTNNISVPSGAVTSNSYSINGGTGFYGSSTGAEVGSAGSYSFSSTTSGNGTPDTYLYRDAANTLAQRNGTNAQTFRLYNTYTDASNYERLSIDWSTTANTATIVTQNAGTGSARTLAIGQDLYVNGVRVGLGGGSVSTNIVIGAGALNVTATGGNNIALGVNTLRNLSSGSSNAGCGNGSLQTNTTGSSNSALGYFSLGLNSNGANNTGVGATSLSSNSSGSNSTAIGSQSLYYNSTGGNQVSIGYNSLFNNTTASNLTAIGYSALYSNTTNVATLGSITGGSSYTNGTYTGVVMTLSSGSTAITYPTATIVVAGGVVTTVTITSAGVGFKDTTTVLTAPAASIGGTGSGFSVPVATLASGTGNVAVGYQAGYSNSVGYSNTFNGYQAGYSNTSGSNNTFNGYQAGYANTTGISNCATGELSLTANTTGQQNSSYGVRSLQTNTSGNYVTAIGYGALASNTGGSYNSANGQLSLAANTTGSFNTAFGTAAGYGNASANANTTGSNNTYIGYQTVGSANNNSNEMVIGYSAVGLGSNTTVIGNSSTTRTKVFGAIESSGYTVSTLPTGVVGMRAYVTNALAPAYGVAVAGGGAVTIPVFYNGTNWICA